MKLELKEWGWALHEVGEPILGRNYWTYSVHATSYLGGKAHTVRRESNHRTLHKNALANAKRACHKLVKEIEACNKRVDEILSTFPKGNTEANNQIAVSHFKVIG